MIELARHIEVLLLDNDCVIVPGFGGFVTHRVPSRRVEEEKLFLPPSRTVGFNPAMKLNDGLLVQSYMVTYDASYPEAVRLVENKVSKLENILHRDGEFELHGIGTLRQNIQGDYTFQPLDSGILSPSLYGLSSFEFQTLEDLAKQEAAEKQVQEAALAAIQKKQSPVMEPSFIQAEEKKVISIHNSRREKYINIAAACIAVLLVSLLALPFVQLGKSTSEMKPVLSSETISEDSRSFVSKIFDAMRSESPTPKIKVVKSSESVKKDTETKVKKEVLPTVKKQVKTESLPKVTSQEKPVVTEAVPTHYFTIVLASQVSRKNAEYFIQQMKKTEDLQAEILEGKFISIVYSHFKTQEEAQEKLRQLRDLDEFKQAWVKEIK